MQKPNILFLITDQQRADHTGFGGNEVLETPNIDSIAARGTVFDAAYVANPICMPNRSTIMTGRMPSVHGTRMNGVSLDQRVNTFVKRLRDAGYRTTHIGKSHLQNMGLGAKALRDMVDFSLDEEAYAAELPTDWNMLENYYTYQSDAPLPEFEDFYGFERAEFAVLHGDTISGHYWRWLKDQGVEPADIQGAPNALERYEGWAQVYQTRVPTELHPSSYVALRCVEEIETAAKQDRPFFVHCSWPDPHHPFTPPGEYWTRYHAADIPLPVSFGDNHDRSMPHYQAYLSHRGSQLGRGVDGWTPTEEQFRHSAAAEYGAIALIDDGVGRILAALDANGCADNTIVVFTSDHGDMFGDHSMMLKHGMHYEGCTRVPLIIARPGDEGRRTQSLAGSIDLAQTLLDLAGVDAYHGMQGHSLVPVLDDPQASVRESVLIEEDQKDDVVGTGQPLRMRTLISKDGRITVYQGHEHGELFDHANDPNEMENLYGESKSMRHQMSEALLEAMLTHANETPRPDFVA